jgi:hypothetical protein
MTVHKSHDCGAGKVLFKIITQKQYQNAIQQMYCEHLISCRCGQVTSVTMWAWSEDRRAEVGARAKLLELTLPRALSQLSPPHIPLLLHALSITECSCSAQLESSLSFLLGKSRFLSHFCFTIEG